MPDNSNLTRSKVEAIQQLLPPLSYNNISKILFSTPWAGITDYELRIKSTIDGFFKCSSRKYINKNSSSKININTLKQSGVKQPQQTTKTQRNLNHQAVTPKNNQPQNTPKQPVKNTPQQPTNTLLNFNHQAKKKKIKY